MSFSSQLLQGQGNNNSGGTGISSGGSQSSKLLNSVQQGTYNPAPVEQPVAQPAAPAQKKLDTVNIMGTTFTNTIPNWGTETKSFFQKLGDSAGQAIKDAGNALDAFFKQPQQKVQEAKAQTTEAVGKLVENTKQVVKNETQSFTQYAKDLNKPAVTKPQNALDELKNAVAKNPQVQGAKMLKDIVTGFFGALNDQSQSSEHYDSATGKWVPGPGQPFVPKNYGEKLGPVALDIANTVVMMEMSGVNSQISLGTKSLGGVIETSATVAKAQDAVASFTEKKMAAITNTFKSSNLTLQDMADVTAGRGTPEQLAAWEKLPRTPEGKIDPTMLKKIVDTSAQNGIDPKTRVYSFLTDVKKKFSDILKTNKETVKLLPDKTVELSTADARNVVVGSNLENTPAGNAILKASIEAEKVGQTLKVGVVDGTAKSTATVAVVDTPGGVTIAIEKVLPGSVIELPGPVAPTAPTAPAGETTTVYRTQNKLEPGSQVFTTPEGAQPFATPNEPVQKFDVPTADLKPSVIPEKATAGIMEYQGKDIVAPTSEDLNMVRDAIQSGDLEAAKALYADLPKGTYMPSFDQLKKEAVRLDERQNAVVHNEALQNIKDKYGSNAEVVQKMKNFLRISADKADPKTGLEFQEHIPRSLFGVSSDEIATTMGISEDEFLQQLLSELGMTKKSVPAAPKEVGVPRSQLPVGSGVEKASRLEARMKNALDNLDKETIDKLGLSTYNQMNRKEQIASAAEYVTNNTKDAIRVLTGEIDAPPGLLKNSIYRALDEMAIGNVELAQKLASLQSTRLGQELNILAGMNPNSPVNIMRDIIRIKEEIFQKRFRGKSVEQAKNKIVEDVKSEIKIPDKYDWNAFLDSIEC